MADQINQMNKMLDPSSTLREGEMATENGGMMANLQMLYDDIMKGNRLTPEIRQRLVDQGVSMMDQMSGGVMREGEIDPNMVIREGEMQQMNKTIDI